MRANERTDMTKLIRHLSQFCERAYSYSKYDKKIENSKWIEDLLPILKMYLAFIYLLPTRIFLVIYLVT